MTAMNFAEGFKSCIGVMFIQVVLTESSLYVSSKQNIFYKKYSDRVIKKNIIGEYQTTVGSCAQRCAKNPQCTGFNVGPMNKGRKVKGCNLTSSTAITLRSNFEDRLGFGFYERKKCDITLKGTMPCPRGYICCSDTRPQICPPNTRGANCSKTCTSYILYNRDLGYGENLIKLEKIKNSTHCWEKCWENEKCLSFTYLSFYSECYLKQYNDVTSPSHVTSIMLVSTNLHVFDCRPYDKATPYA